MIIGNNVNNIEKTGLDSSKKATINADKLGKLQYILTKGLYTDAQSAVIVEWTNNAVDSVVQSGKDPIENPVLVTINNRKLTVEDKGLGLNKDEFENVCMSYLSSTKENDNEAIGHFGIGMKSFMALDRSATFICRKDGIEVKYIAYQGESFMEFDLLYEKETTEINGLICQIDLKDSYEERDFIEKATHKLAYYDTVVLTINGNIIENQIIRSDNWQHSNNHEGNRMKLCLKDVVYELDFNKLGIPCISMPISLRFGLTDPITPTPSRESIIYNQESIRAIKDKIKQISEWFINYYNDNQWKEQESIVDCWEQIPFTGVDVKIKDVEFRIDGLFPYSSSKVNLIKIKGLVYKEPFYYHQLSNAFMNEYECIAVYDRGVFKTKCYKPEVSRLIRDNEVVIEVDSVPVGNNRQFLLEKYSKIAKVHTKIYFIKKYRDRILGSAKYNQLSYRSILDLKADKKSNWRNLIKEFQLMESHFIAKLHNETGLIIPEEWLLKKKELAKLNRNSNSYVSKSLNKQDGDVTLAYARKSTRGVVFDKKVYKISTLNKRYFLTIYGTSDQKELLTNIFNIVPNKVHIIIANKTEIKHLQNRHNFMSTETFMEGKNSTFAKVASAILFDIEVKKFNKIYKSVNQIIQHCTKKFYDDFKILEEYTNKYLQNTGDFSEEILKIATEFNLFDKTLWKEYQNVKKCNTDYGFVTQLANPRTWIQHEIDSYTKTINQMMLFRKKYYNDIDEYDIQLTKKPVEILENEMVEA